MPMDAALEQGLELMLDELGQARTGLSVHLRDKGGRMLLRQAAERNLLGPMVLAVGPGVIQHPVGLWTDGLRALPPMRP